MNALKKEIERKRKLLEEAKVASGGSANSTFVKLGDVEKERERKYLEEQKKNQPTQETQQQPQQTNNGNNVEIKEEEERTSKRRKLDDEKETNTNKENTNINEKSISQEKLTQSISDLSSLSLDEIFKRLRSKGQPITFFAESEPERIERLAKIEFESFEGTVNDEKVESQNELVKKMKKIENEDRQIGLKDEKPPMLKQEEEVKEESEEEEEESEDEAEPKNMSKHEKIYSYFKKILKEWKRDLKAMPEAEKRTANGKQARAIYQQSKDHLKPLFRLLKTKALADELLHNLFELARFLEMKEYIKAHDHYVKMAIGNAPWPMGVTMVGIHERSARERIHSDQIAHVLNDETQRKYIQAVKRLMTFTQKKHPTDPSKMFSKLVRRVDRRLNKKE